MAYVTAHESSLTPELSAKWAANGKKTTGSWQTVFGSDIYTDELFMAWWFAQYAGRVAAAGKTEYPLPMYVNAALIRPNYLPGRYVSAGPLPHLMDVWRAAAPSIDILSPDIYFLNFKEWTDRYSRTDNPLFIPEASLGSRSATNALYVFGTHNAIGFSPFSIESAANPKENPIGKSFAMLSELAPLILAHQGKGTMTGIIPSIAFDGSTDASPQTVKLRGLNYSVRVNFSVPSTKPAPPDPEHPVQVIFGDAGRDYRGPISGALIIALDTNEVLIAGTGVGVTFTPEGAGAPIAGLLSVVQGHYIDGKWTPGLWLNGDQTNQGREVRIGGNEFQILRVRLYRYH
jgi:beta-galactosidase GanA